jgi:hypothetical protein
MEQQAESSAAEGVRAVRPSLLSLLIEEGVASEGELRLIAVEGMGGGVRLGEALLERGWIDEPRLGRLLARQWALPFLEEGSVDAWSAADDALSRERAHELRVFCSRAEDGSLRALVSDPSTDQLDELRRELGDVTFAVITDRELRRLLSDHEVEPAPQLLDDLGAARDRLEELHAHVADVLRAQDAAEAELEQLRDQRRTDQERIRHLEHQWALERDRHRQLVGELAQLAAAHAADPEP